MGHIMFNADMSAYKLFLSALYTDTAPGRFQRYKHKNEKISSCVSGPIACDAMRTKFRKFATATLSIPAAVSPFFIFYYSEHDTNATHTFCCCCWWLHPASGIHMCPRWKAHIRLHSTSDCSLSILLFAHPPPSSGTVASSSWNCLNTEEGYCHCHWLPLMMTFFAYANPSLWTRVGKRRMTQHTQIFPYTVKRSMSERCHRTNVPSVILAAAQALYRTVRLRRFTVWQITTTYAMDFDGIFFVFTWIMCHFMSHFGPWMPYMIVTTSTREWHFFCLRIEYSTDSLFLASAWK